MRLVLAVACVAIIAACSGPADRPPDASDPDVDARIVDAVAPRDGLPDGGGCNGICEGPSDCGGCESDCAFINCEVVCGDFVCDPSECETCFDDCPEGCGPSCGDGWCDEFECADCRIDCPEGCGDVCGDTMCTGAETCLSCAGDCTCVCGDGKCDVTECDGSCAADCPSGCASCAHDLCETGAGLDASCDVCAAAICATNPWCCTGEWDGSCIVAMATVCGKICPASCGDFICTEGVETCESCSTDCGTCPVCGDGWCSGEPTEDCADCPSDCGRCPTTCGDGRCEPGESCVLCASDCGACECGNGLCEFPSETCVSCTGDCGTCVCGDGVCAPGEWVGTCPTDCGSATCSHDVCTSGSALDEACEPCAALVCLGVPVAEVVDMVARVREGKPLYSAEAEWAALSLAAARRLGLPDEWVRRFEEHSPAHRQVLSVVRVVAGSPAARLLRPGDLLLDIDGQVVNRYREVDQATQSPRVRVKVWRAKRELTLDLDTVALDGRDIDRVLIWAGATLQAPHRAMSAQRGIPREGVFVSYFLYGSPASRHKLFAGRRITEVDGTPVADLDAFIAAVKGRPDRSSVRLKTVSWNDSVEVLTVKLDEHYWPTYELRRTADGWQRQPVE